VYLNDKIRRDNRFNLHSEADTNQIRLTNDKLKEKPLSKVSLKNSHRIYISLVGGKKSMARICGKDKILAWNETDLVLGRCQPMKQGRM